MKKAQLNKIVPLALAIVTAGVILGFGFLVMSTTQDQMSDSYENSTAWNGTTETINAVDDFPVWLPIIILVAVGGVILGMVAHFARN